MKINNKALVLATLLMILFTIMLGRWETVTDRGEGPYLVKRDKLTSVTREYLPGKMARPRKVILLN